MYAWQQYDSFHLGATLQFSHLVFNVNENEGTAWPELALSVPAPFSFTVYIQSANTDLSGKLCIQSTYVTGFWKSNEVVTLDLFHLLAQLIATLVHYILFSGASFADPVNLRLRHWDPWRVLHGRGGSEIHPSDGKICHSPSKYVWAYDWHFLDS